MLPGEKQRRSGRYRTVRGYSGMPRRFFGTMGRTQAKVTSQEVFEARQVIDVEPSYDYTFPR